MGAFVMKLIIYICLGFRRGSILSTTIFVYAATAPVNGFMGGSLYSRQGGTSPMPCVPDHWWQGTFLLIFFGLVPFT